jgi:hypothetical protein
MNPGRELGHLPKDVLRKVVRDYVIRLYDLRLDGITNQRRRFAWPNTS